MGGSLGTDTSDIGGIVENGETIALQDVHQLHELHAEAQVGLVAAIVLHGLGPGHPQERLRQLHAADGLEEVLGHTFEEVDDIVLLDKGHLTVYLSEFRLTVGTQIFITEALGNLEIAVETGDHQQLLQRLRTLRKGVELSGIHARGDYEVAGALGRGTYQDGRLHLDEALLVQVFAHFDGHLVAQFQVLAHSRAAQVEVAVFHAYIVASVRIVLDGKGRGERRIEHVQRGNDDFDIARRQVGVLAEAFVHSTGCLYDIFTSQVVGAVAKVGVRLLVEHELGNAIAVAQVDEGHAAHLASALHPSGQRDLLVYIFYAEFSAGVGSIHI